MTFDPISSRVKGHTHIYIAQKPGTETNRNGAWAKNVLMTINQLVWDTPAQPRAVSQVYTCGTVLEIIILCIYMNQYTQCMCTCKCMYVHVIWCIFSLTDYESGLVMLCHSPLP